MAEATVTFALEQLRDLLVEEGRLLSGVGDGVKDLEKQLVKMKCLIEDADKQRNKNKTVKNLIAEIRDLADRAEDAIELYPVRVSSNRRRGVKKVLRRYACILKECQLLHQLDSEIKQIKSSLEEVTKKLIEEKINKQSPDGGESSDDKARKTYSDFEIGDCFVGMEDEVKHLVSLIEDKEHRIISVWGMGGLGKTTIARKVYNEIKKKASCFDRFAWICISQQFNLRSVLEKALKQLGNASSLSSPSEDDLIEQLIEIQRAHRCLIVIDDLWTLSHWEIFKHAFVVEDLQNKVLVTTRKQNLAETIGFSVKHGNLNMDEAWELLKKKAFLDNNIPDQENLRKIGEQMLGKYGCLPLGICVLGGVLRNKSIDDWESVLQNMNEYEYEIRGVLDLSYEELPYYLKPCFLYLGTLQEDESIDALDLYRMWIAQGMISRETHREKKGSLMDIAETYLSELVSRCIVEVEVEDIYPMYKYRSCQLHDAVRKQCFLKGINENFGVTFLKLPGEDRETSLLRYLVIHIASGEVKQGLDELAKKDTYKHVRSLKLVAELELPESYVMYRRKVEFPAQSIVDFQRFKMLRALVIYGFKFGGRKFPIGITNLVHLRCLCLLECEELDELPSSISKLVYLETLDLDDSSDVRIPNVLKKMLKLKHLILPRYSVVGFGSYRLILDEGVDELETLMGFDSRVHELKCSTRMKNLRRLSADVFDNKSLSVIINALDTNWNKLQFSAVIIREGCELTSEEGRKMLKKVFRCHNLHHLKIHVEFGKVPVELENDVISSKLGELYLYCSEIEDDPMGILGKLPVLSDLELSTRSFVGEELTCTASSFPRLKKLSLGGLPKLREWRVERGAMPLLSQLRISDCPCLEKVPDGLSSILKTGDSVYAKAGKKGGALRRGFPQSQPYPFNYHRGLVSTHSGPQPKGEASGSKSVQVDTPTDAAVDDDVESEGANTNKQDIEAKNDEPSGADISVNDEETTDVAVQGDILDVAAEHTDVILDDQKDIGSDSSSDSDVEKEVDYPDESDSPIQSPSDDSSIRFDADKTSTED